MVLKRNIYRYSVHFPHLPRLGVPNRRHDRVPLRRKRVTDDDVLEGQRGADGGCSLKSAEVEAHRGNTREVHDLSVSQSLISIASIYDVVQKVDARSFGGRSIDWLSESQGNGGGDPYAAALAVASFVDGAVHRSTMPLPLALCDCRQA